jgi:hypothetical protein
MFQFLLLLIYYCSYEIFQELDFRNNVKYCDKKELKTLAAFKSRKASKDVCCGIVASTKRQESSLAQFLCQVQEYLR